MCSSGSGSRGRGRGSQRIAGATTDIHMPTCCRCCCCCCPALALIIRWICSLPSVLPAVPARTRSHPRALANNCSVATTRCNRRSSSTVVRARYFHSKIMKCAERLICFLILIYRSIIRFICIYHIQYIRLQEQEPENLWTFTTTISL